MVPSRLPQEEFHSGTFPDYPRALTLLEPQVTFADKAKFCLFRGEGTLANRPIVTLTTDFGLNDHFIGTMKGVILNIAPDAEIVDINHAVQAFDVLDGALTIAQSYSYFPSGTIHVVVVDPGVGTARRPILLSTEKYYFVAPDNGVLSLVYNREERIRVRHITGEHYFLQPVSSTFHGRDVFAPVAGWLAKGVDGAKFGEEISDYVRFNAPKPKPVDGRTFRGVVLKVDRFGNLVTNFTPQDVPMLFQPTPPPFKIVVGKREITELHQNYSEGEPNELFGILGSMGYLEIAANRAAAAQLVGSGKGSEVSVVLGETAAAANGA
jgi:S-adenosylmethionine hydrolase